MTEAEIMQRLASIYARGIEVTRKHGLADGLAAQAMLLAAVAVLLDACGPAASAGFLREVANRIEADHEPRNPSEIN